MDTNRPGVRAPGSPAKLNPDPAGPTAGARGRRLLWVLGGAVVLVGLLVPNLAGSASAPDHASEFRAEGPEMGAMLARLVGGTVFVLALCVVTLWGCRRWLGGANAGPKTDGRFEIVESLPLGPRCRVHLLRADDRHLLAGLDATGLKVLLPVEGTVEIADADLVEPRTQ